jgi:hypothetical protein
MDILNVRRRNEEALEILKDSRTFDTAIRELKQKRRAERQRIIGEIAEAERSFPPVCLAAGKRTEMLADALRRVEKEFLETRTAYYTAAGQSAGYAGKFEGEINVRRIELAKLADERIKQTYVWLETLDDLAKGQLHFWTVSGRDYYGEQTTKQMSSLEEVEAVRSQLRQYHATVKGMLYIDYGDDPGPELLKIKAGAEAAMKKLEIDLASRNMPKLEFDELSFHREIPTLKV